MALVVHPRRPTAVELASQAAAWLQARGHQVRVPKDDADAIGLGEHACAPEELVAGLDLAVSLGGDGTMLRAVSLVSAHNVPVLGVNLGRLGYLAAVEPAALPAALEAFGRGAHFIDERMMLGVDVHQGGGLAATHVVLNEAVLEKPSPGHTVHLAVRVDERPFITYAADGLIVATPTGSTAYAFSARGPIVSPRARAMLMVPVSPHMPFDRSLVFDPSEPVTIEVIDQRPAMLIVDGRELGLLGAGDSIRCTVAPRTARFVVLEPRDFYGLLKTKFGLADR